MFVTWMHVFSATAKCEVQARQCLHEDCTIICDSVYLVLFGSVSDKNITVYIIIVTDEHMLTYIHVQITVIPNNNNHSVHFDLCSAIITSGNVVDTYCRLVTLNLYLAWLCVKHNFNDYWRQVSLFLLLPKLF